MSKRDYKLAPFSESVGKTIRRIFEIDKRHAESCFCFTDDTFCIVWGYDDGSINCLVEQGLVHVSDDLIQKTIQMLQYMDE